MAMVVDELERWVVLWLSFTIDWTLLRLLLQPSFPSLLSCIVIVLSSYCDHVITKMNYKFSFPHLPLLILWSTVPHFRFVTHQYFELYCSSNGELIAFLFLMKWIFLDVGVNDPVKKLKSPLLFNSLSQ